MKNLYLSANYFLKMKRFSILIFLNITLLFMACVPTKDLIYLQNKNESKTSASVEVVNIKPYRIKANDILSVTIKTLDAKLSQIFTTTTTNVTLNNEQALYYDGFTVDDRGNIRIPVLGEINVLGFTADEIRIKIEEILLKDYFNKQSNLFVNVKLSGFRYTINGEVGSTGSKVLFTDKVNILEAIANSGDITVVGDRKNVQIIRQMPQGTEIHSLDLTDINVTKSPNYYLQPNDYIYVKPLKQKTWGTGKTGIESLSTIITLISLVTTTFLLLKK